MILTFRPIKVWPEGWSKSRGRPSSPFRSTYQSTLNLLDHELHALGTKDALLQVDASEADVRLDGQLRANAIVGHPGVILTIDTRKHGTLVYPCDAFSSWQGNLRAIALGLEALRKVERYGIAERGQQYAGYRELGSGIALGAGKMTVEEAARFLHDAAAPESLEVPWERLLTAPELVTEGYRLAAKRLHPDQGGDPALFRKLTEARDLLTAMANG